jgi:hypothetical protein
MLRRRQLWKGCTEILDSSFVFSQKPKNQYQVAAGAVDDVDQGEVEESQVAVSVLTYFNL